MSEDKELEYLKRKRLLELRRRILVEKAIEANKEREEEKPKNPKDILKFIFTDSAWTVWRAAEQQYPKVAEEVAKTLADLSYVGKIRKNVTGEQLYWLFSELGFRIRIETKIRILDKGEMKTIAEKLREK